MKSRWVLAGLAGFAAFLLNSCTTSNNPNNPNSGSGFMWVTTQGDQMVTAYTISLSNGSASQIGSAVPTGLGPVGIAISPAANALFVANRDDNTVSYYAFNSDGSLTNPCPSPKPANCNTIAAGPVAGTPVALAIDPSGKFLFVANQAKQSVFPPPNTPDTVAVFTVASGGALTKAGNFASTGNGPSALVASPTGNFLYVANRYTNTISILSYDANGTLTEVLGSPVPAGTNPAGLSLSRCAGTTTATTTCTSTATPAFLFVANEGSNDVDIFTACIQVTTACPSANGSLTALPTSPVSASGTHPVSVIVDPAHNFVYVVNNGSFEVSQYQFGPATGTLTPLSPATISTGSSPLSGGMTSDGQWLFVPNNGGSSVSGFTQVTPSGTAPTGKLGVGTPVALVGQPSAVLVR